MSDNNPVTINCQIPEPAEHRRISADISQQGSYYLTGLDYHGWSVVCFWSYESSPVPESIEIRRKTAVGELAIEGKLKLLRSGETILEQNFMQLMRSGSTFIEIQLNNANLRSRRPSGRPFLLKACVEILPIQRTLPTTPPMYRRITKHFQSLLSLANDFKQLTNPQTSRIAVDVNLKCGSASIPAHKTVLGARSPVFAAMFANPMRESEKNQVDINDISEPVLRAIVYYMYTAVVEKMTISSAPELLVAADKYQLLSLKLMCCDFLKENVSDENVSMLLDLGDAFAEDLKCFAMAYICQCPDLSAIQNTEAWKSLEESKPSLAVEVLTSVVKSRDEKIKKLKT
ncbi:Speckle-type POZ protein-like A [Araneus ventricosus]|uniref:Speckle-type POZ protein-like A n=1 Tax=Araneus ventricosus TaxID=182803 RepID=A0A4Y2SVU2_ARAVE|nr:Speckle-type POZ protein-like A [Araneus ventricosus]